MGKCVLDVRAVKMLFCLDCISVRGHCIPILFKWRNVKFLGSALKLCDDKLAILCVNFTQIRYQNNTSGVKYIPSRETSCCVWCKKITPANPSFHCESHRTINVYIPYHSIRFLVDPWINVSVCTIKSKCDEFKSTKC